jgi:enoyl-CoA hydratase/carnithine racemase
MGAIDMTTATFTCHQEDDLAVITILEGAEIVTTTVGGKQDLLEAMKKINAAQQIKGVAVLYSDKYRGDAEYKKFLIESLEGIRSTEKSRFATTYKYAIIQFLERIISFPKPIVGGMEGDIGPTSFAFNLAFDLRISADETKFFFPNLKLGIPPAPLLAHYFVQSLGSFKATELFLTKSALSAQDAFNLGLITQIVSKEKLKKTCLDKLRQLSNLSGNTLVETRRMLQPDMDGLRNYINAGFDGAIRCMYNI